MTIIDDLKVTRNSEGIFDFSIEDYDLATVDSLDTNLSYALMGERRASESEVQISEYRRGWIGNEGKAFENGSKLWLFKQSRLSRTILNDIQSTALDALSYLIDNKAAVDIEASASISQGYVMLEVRIFITRSKVETRFFTLWKNTGG